MFETVLPNLALLFAPEELARESTPAPSGRYRRGMIKQTLRAYGHWLDQDTLGRMLKELEGEPPPRG